MKLILIRLGKIFSVFRMVGFVGGVKIVYGYLNLFLKSLFTSKSGDVLIISAGLGASAYYRAYNHAEELNSHGLKTSVIMLGMPLPLKLADNFKIFIFQRTLATPAVMGLIKAIKEKRREIIFETDDLVFDAKFVKNADFYEGLSAAEKMQYEKGVGEEIVKDPYVKICTTATSYLAKILESYGKRVFVVKNKISNEELEAAENFIENSSKEKNKYIRIGYLSGSASHNKDFETISPAFLEILEKYKNAMLVIVGPLNISEKFNKFGERVERLPFASRKEYYRLIFNLDIDIAPLVLGDPFCESKSELKFIEAGVLAVPTVAVANQTFSEAIIDGQDGFLARAREEWVDKIGRLIEDESLRLEMGARARQKVLADYSVKNSHQEQYYAYLRSKLV